MKEVHKVLPQNGGSPMSGAQQITSSAGESLPAFNLAVGGIKPVDIPSRQPSPGVCSDVSIDDDQQASIAHPMDRGPFWSTAGWKRRITDFWVKNLGLAYVVISQFFGVAMNITVRFLEVQGNKGKGLHPFQVLSVRMGITAVLCMSYMAYSRTPYFPLGMKEVRWLLVTRGMGGFFGVFGMYYSLLYLPVSDATVITYLAPGLSCWVCSFLIREPFTRIDRLGTMVSLLGVIFIAKPTALLALLHHREHSGSTTQGHDQASDARTPPEATNSDTFRDVTPEQRLGAVGVALVGVFGAVVAFTTIRWIGKRAHPLISVNYFAVWGTIASVVLQAAVPGIGFILPADAKEWGLLILLGCFGFIMQFLLAAGLAYEKSSRATNMTYTSMLFALAGDKIFFKAVPGVNSIIGSTMILGAAIVMTLQKGDTAKDTNGRDGQVDEERGLIDGMELQEGTEPRMPISEVQTRALR